MTREQFNRLLRNPSTINLNFISDLEEITRRFPYFANAHILLAKQYHGHENIKYESHLRKASAYAPDRSLLFHLIKQEPGEVIHITPPAPSEKNPVPEHTLPKSDTTSPETDVAFAEITPAPPEPTPPAETEVLLPVSASDNQHPATTEPIEKNTDEQQLSPLEIIERRLRELEGNSKKASEPASVTDHEPGIPEPQIHPKTEDLVKEHPVPAKPKETEPAEQKAVTDSEPGPEGQTKAGTVKPERQKKETASDLQGDANGYEKSSDSDTDKGSPISAPARTIQDIPITHSFSEWLKIKSIPVIAAENIGEYLLQNSEPPDTTDHTDYQPDLIEKFIKSEPRIVAGKSEFYSPGNMARRSAVEHEDLISETLARIYAQQGNIPKAIDAYQRLSLKNPEKSTYFAALIKELEDRPDGLDS